MSTTTGNLWRTLREASGITQREAERLMGWKARGRLSLIERGLYPNQSEEDDMRRLYGTRLLAPTEGRPA